jgi:hypothetical protein
VAVRPDLLDSGRGVPRNQGKDQPLKNRESGNDDKYFTIILASLTSTCGALGTRNPQHVDFLRSFLRLLRIGPETLS